MPIMAILQRKEQDFDPTGLAAARYQKWLRTPAVEREDEGDTLLEDWECKFLKKRFFEDKGELQSWVCHVADELLNEEQTCGATPSVVTLADAL